MKLYILPMLTLVIPLVHIQAPAEAVVEPSNTEFATQISAYPALKQAATPTLANGLYGMVKILAEHSLQGKDAKGREVQGSFVAQGAGSIVMVRNQMFIITARHVVLPNSRIQQIVDKANPKKKLDFAEVNVTASKVLVGALAVVPNGIWLSKVDDIAVIGVDSKDQQAVLDVQYRDPSAPIELKADREMITPGMKVEAWGFPARQSPQIEPVAISSVENQYFVLNRALLRGYSGGLVLVNNANGEKSLGGIIIRADESANQSTVLKASKVVNILQVSSTNGSSSDIQRVTIGKTTLIGNIAYTLKAYY